MLTLTNYSKCGVCVVQELHKRARQQFKGLFDKKPGEIAEAGDTDLPENAPSARPDVDDQDALDDGKERLLEATAPPPRSSIWSKIWTPGKRVITTLGLDRCTIL